MKPVENTVSKYVCTACRPDLFKKYTLYWWDGHRWSLDSNRCTEDPSRTKVLKRIEPPVLCHIHTDGTERWQFTLEDYPNETS